MQLGNAVGRGLLCRRQQGAWQSHTPVEDGVTRRRLLGSEDTKLDCGWLILGSDTVRFGLHADG